MCWLKRPPYRWLSIQRFACMPRQYEQMGHLTSVVFVVERLEFAFTRRISFLNMLHKHHAACSLCKQGKFRRKMTVSL